MRHLFILFSFFLFLSCGESDPQCITDEIVNFQNIQADCPSASVIKYKFQDQILYGFSDGTCIQDGGTNLIDENCNAYCFIGGIAALTDCKGENFFNNAEEIDVIWVNN